MSDRYTVEVWGGCLGPAIPDGTQLIADAAETIRPGDVCSVVLRDGKGPWDAFMRQVWSEVMSAEYPNKMAKIYLARGVKAGREVVLLGQLYPPCIGVISVDEIEAMHRIVGAAGQCIQVVSESERASFEMLTWCAGQPSAPLNPDWRPPELASKQLETVKTFTAWAEALGAA